MLLFTKWSTSSLTITTSLNIVQQPLIEFALSGWQCRRNAVGARYKLSKTQRKRQEIVMNAATALWSRCVNVAKLKKKHVQTLWINIESAIETQWDPIGHWEVSVRAQLNNHFVYTAISSVPWAPDLQIQFLDLVALLDTLRRYHGDLTPLLRHVYQNLEKGRALCACSKSLKTG